MAIGNVGRSPCIVVASIVSSQKDTVITLVLVRPGNRQCGAEPLHFSQVPYCGAEGCNWIYTIKYRFMAKGKGTVQILVRETPCLDRLGLRIPLRTLHRDRSDSGPELPPISFPKPRT